jgi:hypothetical protein
MKCEDFVAPSVEVYVKPQSSKQFAKLFSVIYVARFTDYRYLDLSGIIKLVFDLLCNISCKDLHVIIADKLGLEKVCVVPHPRAGGSFATAAWHTMKNPVAVEEIKADAGIDIGTTLIGMHLKRVAVPVRLENNIIGEAKLSAARTRPKYIGGERAKYE